MKSSARTSATLILGVILLIGTGQVSAQALKIDVDDRGAADAANTEPGFQQFLLGGAENDDNTEPTSRTFGANTVTISHSNGGAYGDRRRDEPTNAGDFTDQELLRDFTFARGETPDDGLDILIEALEPEANYDVRIWSYDTSSNNPRISDWTANGVLVMDDYTFDGVDVPPDPADNDVYAFDFVAAADLSGNLLIEGRWVSGPCCGVFLNALSVDLAVPPTADFNGDGVVDTEDFFIQRDNFLAHLDGPVAPADGDYDRDGDIDLDDFGAFKAEFPAVVAAGLKLIPEPSSFALLVTALLGLGGLFLPSRS